MTDTIGFIRVILPRYAEAGQRSAMEAHSISLVVQEGGKRGTATVADLIRMACPGRVFAVQHAMLLADPKTKRKRGGTRASFWAVLDAIEAKGAIIWVLYTGLRTDKPAERDRMTREAIEALARGRHKTSAHDKRGRPPKTFTEAQIERGRAVWESRKYKRWQDAAKHLPKGMTVRHAWKLFGRRDTEET